MQIDMLKGPIDNPVLINKVFGNRAIVSVILENVSNQMEPLLGLRMINKLFNTEVLHKIRSAHREIQIHNFQACVERVIYPFDRPITPPPPLPENYERPPCTCTLNINAHKTDMSKVKRLFE
ncbi:DUF4325 domain-containing protein [Caenorhabditis elegans]|uniref:DUF4325 domain-containing protein n=1 Tax=Caenorhabditis elegans TaxID=6239 RepID=D3NQB8_CAEEL|nr:DUF4325 domain-containing protein [Caenorhabditis elegans]CBK19506.1 DUF4325 domain-containing protein [Caenorhabditis elegans]|eukprot:NP_001254455.1 Uncharacterized protein CELE_Y53F4B.43 [Caenorhabditis elegans]